MCWTGGISARTPARFLLQLTLLSPPHPPPLQNGWRFVFDLTGGRRFRIWRGDELLLDTTAPLLGMDGPTSGWQRQSDAEHERDEDGLSLVMDTAQAAPGMYSGSGSLAKTRVANFFSKSSQPVFQRPAGGRWGAQERRPSLGTRRRGAAWGRAGARRAAARPAAARPALPRPSPRRLEDRPLPCCCAGARRSCSASAARGSSRQRRGRRGGAHHAPALLPLRQPHFRSQLEPG